MSFKIFLKVLHKVVFSIKPYKITRVYYFDFRLAVIIFFFFGNLYSSDFSNFRNWFSEKKVFRNGYEFLQISIHDKKFTVAKLSFNEERKWEETRVIGVVEENESGELSLQPEMCTVYATKKLGLRWILIQGFDCDHFKMHLTKTERGLIISPSIGISESEVLKQEIKNTENVISAIIISKEENIFQAWALGMRYIKTGSFATINGKPITIIETVDSTGTFKSKEQLEIGDIIQIKNRSQSNFFE